ncbi:helix-hairpin-helix domain-containing protein [Paraflavitalea speifideaquila]|uniref:helix-hairpin-helix domain-containing protein n=1 Tax=Paraflavitalea speifideaquila TaxID=3076558 RepID=UPI0028EC4F5D|nr:helix-hairpin-helix domain-containing protein [Paraflavitalea speifideiaquila]
MYPSRQTHGQLLIADSPLTTIYYICPMTIDNTYIADQFDLLSKIMDIHGENSFKSKTYSVAAFNIEK